MLHTLNKSPFSHTSLENCLRFIKPDDVLLLLEDGVYAATRGTSRSHLIEQALQNGHVFAMQADLKARGLTDLIDGVQLADYDKFVELLEQHSSHAWR
ncbi:MAG: sulfurtransferase complex subunit TusB [Gammaproteobacteria bacterium]|nr:sulfurtransferase complex subunit TusB [Gammaproteobacteria bacterium]